MEASHCSSTVVVVLLTERRLEGAVGAITSISVLLLKAENSLEKAPSSTSGNPEASPVA